MLDVDHTIFYAMQNFLPNSAEYIILSTVNSSRHLISQTTDLICNAKIIACTWIAKYLKEIISEKMNEKIAFLCGCRTAQI